MHRSIAFALCLLLAACAQLPQRADLPEELAPAPASSGAIAERVAPMEARHPGQSGFRLVAAGSEAYALRAYSAEAATTSLDIQSYIWKDDLTGKLLARHALLAADRGVRVRILADDFPARVHNAGFAALDAHPNLEVRIYNPLVSRSGLLRMGGEFATDFRRLNHRMHNKSWIADNRIALVGGRNLGDEYFDAHTGVNFIDLDMLMTGPVVQEVSATFDAFWNSPSSFPIAQLSPRAVSPEALQRMRGVLDDSLVELGASEFEHVLREDPQVHALLAGETYLRWHSEWRFVSDDPQKKRLDMADRSEVLRVLLPVVHQARRNLRILTPYFVPAASGTAELVAAAQRGPEVQVLTNSLAATDVAIVHGGYMRSRRPLLRGGVQLWELRPVGTTDPEHGLMGVSGASLHTKAMIVDDEQIFVGSYNLDPRSKSLNTEQGVLVADPVMAAELTRMFDAKLQGERAWKVTLHGNRLRWSDGKQVWTRDPQAGVQRRILAWLARVLPIESQL
ncbi:phospholipase D-like domain-containing protein [Luteimonas sp. A649]